MAVLSLFLFSALIISTAAARSLPSASSPPSKPGPISFNGKNYTRVCDPTLFADAGLDMKDFAYCDVSLPYDARLKDLVGRMTLAEKVGQLGDKGKGVPRIGLPKYGWWSEALHGVAETGHATYFGDIVPSATSFPTTILVSASFNESLWKTLGRTISTEARAMYNLGHTGLDFWSPNINVIRDPRWGRALETPGEDPFAVGRYGINFVRGLQDVEGQEVTEDLNSRPLKVSACCKHYAAYDLDNWFGVQRFTYDARVAEQDMVETFVRPFEMCIKEGDASSIMCSYNRVNGMPVCADTKIMSQTIRDEWNLHGYIVSDCDAAQVMVERLKWLGDTGEDAVAQVMEAGLDLDCGLGNSNYYENFTESAVVQGKMRESDIDNALMNIYRVLMRVGFFDSNPIYESLGVDDICTKDHLELATDSARQGIVLLKNSDDTLPISPQKYKKIALIGPHFNATKTMIGNYAGIPCNYVTPYDAFKADVKVDYHLGCDVDCNDEGFFSSAVEAAKDADATVLLMGLDISEEAEDHDRMDLLLPGHQEGLIKRVAEAAKGPVVLVIFSGGCLDISFAESNPKIGAVIWAGYPGEQGGKAIADVIFGRYNPGGRLPMTWYKNDYVDSLPMTSMQLRPNDDLAYPGRTYKFFNGTVLYPFGHGLSYTQFNYTLKSHLESAISMQLSPLQRCKHLAYKPGSPVPSCAAALVEELKCRSKITFSVKVSNVGSSDGSHIVMVYSKPPAAVVGAPAKQLVAFRRVFVRAGGIKTVHFKINACKALGIVEKTAYLVVPSGEHTIVVGDGEGVVSFPVEVQFKE